MHRDIKVFIK